MFARSQMGYPRLWHLSRLWSRLRLVDPKSHQNLPPLKISAFPVPIVAECGVTPPNLSPYSESVIATNCKTKVSAANWDPDLAIFGSPFWRIIHFLVTLSQSAPYFTAGQEKSTPKTLRPFLYFSVFLISPLAQIPIHF